MYILTDAYNNTNISIPSVPKCGISIVSSRIVEEVEEAVLQSGVLHLLFLKQNTIYWVVLINNWDREMVHLINCLPHKREVLSLIPSIHIKKLT